MGLLKIPTIASTDRSSSTWAAAELLYDSNQSLVYYGNGVAGGGVSLATGGGGGGGVAISAAGNSVSNNTVVFSNSNGISFGMAGSTVTAQHNALTSQSNQAVSGTNGSFAFQTITFGSSNGAHFYTTNGSLVVSYTVPSGDGGVAISAAGNSVSNNTVVFSNSNGISFGMAGSTVTAQHNAITTQSGQAVSGSNGSFAFETVTFGNSNGASFYTTNGSMVVSYTVPTQSNQTIGGYALTNTTGESSSSTLDARSLSIVGGGQVSVGFSAGRLLISTPTPVIPDSTMGIYALSTANTTGQSSSSTADYRSLSISFAGIASGGWSNGSLLISVPAGGGAGFSAGMSTDGNTAGSEGTVSQRLVLVGSQGVSLSQSTNLGSATLTIYGPAKATTVTPVSSVNASGTVSTRYALEDHAHAGLNIVSIVGNTSGTTTAGAGSIVLAGGPNLTISCSTAAGGMTASFSAAAAGGGATRSYYEPYANRLNVVGQQGQGTLHFNPMPLDGAIQFDRLVMLIHNTNSSNSSGSHTLSFWGGIYTKNASSLSLLASASQSMALTHSGTVGSYSLYSGIRMFTIGLTTTLTAGDYWLGILSRTTSGGANGTYSQVLASAFSSTVLGHFSSSHNTTMQFHLGRGIYTATTSAMPGSVGFNQIRGSDVIAMRPPIVFFASSTV
jgi:hypothetical protein